MIFIFKLIVSILVGTLAFLLLYNYSTDEKPYAAMESFVVFNTVLILLLAIICIWI